MTDPIHPKSPRKVPTQQSSDAQRKRQPSTGKVEKEAADASGSNDAFSAQPPIRSQQVVRPTSSTLQGAFPSKLKERFKDPLTLPGDLSEQGVPPLPEGMIPAAHVVQEALETFVTTAEALRSKDIVAFPNFSEFQAALKPRAYAPLLFTFSVLNDPFAHGTWTVAGDVASSVQGFIDAARSAKDGSVTLLGVKVPNAARFVPELTKLHDVLQGLQTIRDGITKIVGSYPDDPDLHQAYARALELHLRSRLDKGETVVAPMDLRPTNVDNDGSAAHGMVVELKPGAMKLGLTAFETNGLLAGRYFLKDSVPKAGRDGKVSTAEILKGPRSRGSDNPRRKCAYVAAGKVAKNFDLKPILLPATAYGRKGMQDRVADLVKAADLRPPPQVLHAWQTVGNCEYKSILAYISHRVTREGQAIVRALLTQHAQQTMNTHARSYGTLMKDHADFSVEIIDSGKAYKASHPGEAMTVEIMARIRDDLATEHVTSLNNALAKKVNRNTVRLRNALKVT